jgi:two-component system phosphate regulon response regulator PhoB
MTHLPPTILIIEPDVVFRTGMSNVLERSGFSVMVVGTGEDALNLIDNMPEYKQPNVIIINYNLPGLSGVQNCTILRGKKTTKSTPIILIISEHDQLDEIKNLKNVFDEVMVKPFVQSDLVTKVKSILGRIKPVLLSKNISYKELKIDLASFRVTRGNRDIHLGPTEFKILQCLMESPKRIFSRDYLMNYVWGKSNNVEIRTVDVHINRLRTALKNPNENLPFIKTVRSAGYCLSLPGVD